MRLPSATAITLDTSPQASRSRLETAARELESQFAQMMLKSMRSASIGKDPLAGDPMYRDMYDQQLSRELSKGRGLGLAPMIMRQLERSTGAAPPMPVLPLEQPGGARLPIALPGAPGAMSLLPPGSGALQLMPTAAGVSMSAVAPPLPPAPPAPATAVLASTAGKATADTSGVACEPLDCSSPEAFVKSIWPHAQKTAAELGVSAKAIVAQAALETGWGRRLVGGGKGESNNLFGIKASARWVGDKVSSATHEFVNGVRQNQRAQFRAYTSAAESFADYAKLLGGSRYADARGTGDDTRGFASALQRAGYATDPSYADKITAIANGATLRRALASLPSIAGNTP